MNEEYPNAPPWIDHMLADSEFLKAQREFYQGELSSKYHEDAERLFELTKEIPKERDLQQ